MFSPLPLETQSNTISHVIDLSEYMTAADAAKFLGVAATTVTAYCRDDDHPLKGVKLGRWYVERSSVMRYIEIRGNAGWPKGKPRKPKSE